MIAFACFPVNRTPAALQKLTPRELTSAARICYHPRANTNGPEPILKNMPMTSSHDHEPEWHQSEAIYRELFENSPEAIYVHDLNGRYTLVNRAAEELCGYRREEILGKHYSNFVLPNYLKTVRENFCRKLDVPLETTYEAEILCRDGTRKPVEVRSRMISRNGEPAGVQGVVRDISELKRVQKALERFSRRPFSPKDSERSDVAEQKG